jgi:hypothetical protein
MITRTLIPSRIALISGLCAALALAPQPILAQTEPVGGQPPIGSTPSVPSLDEQVAYQRAFEAMVWAIPAHAIYRMRIGFNSVPGGGDNVVLAYDAPMTQPAAFITPNNTTPYLGATFGLQDGPVVVEIPAATDKASLYGQIVDAWQATIVDVGPAGPDGGKGAKLLLVPPGWTDPIPEGYVVVQSPSFRLIAAFRSVSAPGATDADAYAYSQTIRIYPLSEAANPPPTVFVDPKKFSLQTLPIYDITALKDIHDIINVEPVREQDKVMLGMLATIGIEKGKPFDPPAELIPVLERGVRDAYFYTQELTLQRHLGNLWWPDRHWSFVMIPDENGGFEYVTDNAIEVDKRAATWKFFTLYPRTLTEQAGVIYLAPMADSTGTLLQPGKNYRMTIPADVPARQFWSLTMYDQATWSFIINPLERAGLSSRQLDQMKVNDDGSVDIYFGPDAPEGLESNWLPTMGKTPYIWFRIYGPDTAFWDKSFKLADPELLP